MYKKWIRFMDLLEKIVTQVGAVLMASMAILVTYQVFARYILHYSPYWTEEIATTVLMWVGLFGAAGATWTDTHMDLSMLVERFPKGLQAWLRAFSDLLVAGFALFLFFDGIRLVNENLNGTLSSLPILVGYTYLILPIAGALMAIFGLFKAVTRIMNHYVLKEEVKGVNVHV